MSVSAPAINANIPHCEYCKQPLLNQAAIRALEASKAAIAKKISEAVSAKAAELAAEKIAAIRERLEKAAEAKVELRYRGRIRDLTRTVERAVSERNDMQRKLQQSTAADRGALHEADVVRLLMDAFPEDRIEHRGKGGDVLHEVFYVSGSQRTSAGLIVYECKDTLRWSDDFIGQIKEAAEEHRTRYAVIVTKAFPPKEKDILMRDGIIAVHPDRLVELVKILRDGICAIHRAGLTADGQAEKTRELYRYLTSNDFRQHSDAIGELDHELRKMLADERKTHERTWQKREGYYGERERHSTAIGERIKNIIERAGAGQRGKVVALPPAS